MNQVYLKSTEIRNLTIWKDTNLDISAINLKIPRDSVKNLVF